MTTVCAVLISCQQSQPIDESEWIGEMYNLEGAEHYTHLELRGDYTFQFDQSTNWSCDFWQYSFGTWDVEENSLNLYEGVNLDSVISVTKYRDVTSDTLTVAFEVDFIRELPKFKVRIGLDSVDAVVENGKIVLDKYEYCIKNRIFDKGSTNTESTYMYYPLELKIRADQYYTSIDYILSEKLITIKLGAFKRKAHKSSLLIRYEKLDSILASIDYQDWVLPHKIAKKKY